LSEWSSIEVLAGGGGERDLHRLIAEYAGIDVERIGPERVIVLKGVGAPYPAAVRLREALGESDAVVMAFERLDDAGRIVTTWAAISEDRRRASVCRQKLR